MPAISVAVIGAKTPGNIGTIARAMKNFGVEELLLVDPPDLSSSSEAYGFAGQAREDVLPNATETTFDDIVRSYHTIGFTAFGNPTDTKHIRYPITTPARLADELEDIEANVALVFGRERIGLTNDELAQLDRLCAIPATPAYSSLNLGQAATVALYELRSLTLEETQLPEELHDRASEVEIEAFYDHAERLLDALEYPPERREKTEVVFRRVLGRAQPTSREIATLHGVLRRCEYCLDAT